MAIYPPEVINVIRYLNNLKFGRYDIDDFVAKVHQKAWKEIVIDYCQTHPELYFVSDMTAIRKIDISCWYREEPKKEAA